MSSCSACFVLVSEMSLCTDTSYNLKRSATITRTLVIYDDGYVWAWNR